jgi:alpha-tubulin suppressor-like RCC1 family protein
MTKRIDRRRRAGRVVAACALAVTAVAAPTQPAAAVAGLPGPSFHAARAWGHNGSGQLGDGTSTNRPYPAEVDNLPGTVTRVAGGFSHSLALTSTGTVWAWGANPHGQLGDGTTTSSTVARQVVGLSNVVQIAAGEHYSLALRSDGTVWAWGRNHDGVLGDGTNTDRRYPTRVVGLTGVTRIAAGSEHALALRSDGTVWSWGAGGHGQLGDGERTSRAYPAPASHVGGPAVQISAGQRHSIALLADGTVRTWGDNTASQLGVGDPAYLPNSPVGLDVGLRNVSQVAAGWRHNLVSVGGIVYTWGVNFGGQLGDGTTSPRHRPAPISVGASDVLQLAGGVTHSAALVVVDGTRTVMAWGLNDVGQVGDGTTLPRYRPVEAHGLRGATTVAAGHHHTVAVKPTTPPVCCG